MGCIGPPARHRLFIQMKDAGYSLCSRPELDARRCRAQAFRREIWTARKLRHSEWRGLLYTRPARSEIQAREPLLMKQQSKPQGMEFAGE